MLNTERITSNCINSLPLAWIACPQENHGAGIIIAPITEEQEKELDSNNMIVLRDQYSRTFIATPKNSYAYGKLNLSPKSEDINKILKAQLFRGFYINIVCFTDYDYDSHTVTSDVPGGRWYETDNVENYLPFLHGKIGNPERVVIFKINFDILSSKRNKNNNRTAKHKHNVSSKDYYKSYSKQKTELKRKAKVSNLRFTIKK